MKKILLTAFILLLSFVFGFSCRNVKAESSSVDFSSIPRFNAYVKGEPSFSRIYFTFDGPILAGSETSKILPGDKVDGITNKVYINGRNLDEHFELNNYIELRFLNNVNGIDTIEIIYFFNSDEKMEFIERQTTFSIDSGFDTGYAKVENGVTALYNGKGFDIYRDTSVSGLKTLLLKNYKDQTAKCLEYEYMGNNKELIESMISEGESLIKTGKTCVEITKGGIFSLLKIEQFSDINKINPIDIERVEKAYQYPNKDISFRILVDKNYSDNLYSHVTLDTDTLKTYIGDDSKFYNEDIIKEFEKYDVQNGILNYFSINGILLKDIYEMDESDEPVRIDYEIGNDYSKFYALTVYINHDSTFAKTKIKSLDDLNTITFSKGFRFIKYNLNKNYTYSFDSVNKKWSLCSLNSLEEILKEYEKLDLALYTNEYKEKILSLKERIEEAVKSSLSDEEKLIELINAHYALLSNVEYIEHDSIVVFKDFGFVSKNNSHYLEMYFDVTSENIKIDLNENTFDESLVSLNDMTGVNLKVANGMLVISISLNDIQDENTLKINESFKFSNQYKLGADYTYSFTKNDLKAKDEQKEYSINVIGDNVEVIGERTGIQGSKIELSFKAKENYKVVSVVIDGKDQGSISTYSFENLDSNHTIQIIVSSKSQKGCKSSLSILSLMLVTVPMTIAILAKKKEEE